MPIERKEMSKEEAEKFSKEIDEKRKSILATGVKSTEGIYFEDGKYRSITFEDELAPPDS